MQRVCEISKMIRYLLVGRGPGTSITRLAGPAFCRNLIQLHNPFDGSHHEFAFDLAHQIERSVMHACFGEARPHDLCTHVIMSIPPRYRSRNPLSPSIKTQRVVNEGTYSGALEIALDVLDMLEVDHRLALFCVVHCDRRHMHVHALVGRFASGAIPFAFNRSAADLIRISKEIDQRYGLGKNSIAFDHSRNQANYADR